MKKTIEKYFCDFCGKECEHTPEFKIPRRESTHAYKLREFRIGDIPPITTVSNDICPECQEKVVRLLDFVKYANIDKDGNMTIKFS